MLSSVEFEGCTLDHLIVSHSKGEVIPSLPPFTVLGVSYDVDVSLRGVRFL